MKRKKKSKKTYDDKILLIIIIFLLIFSYFELTNDFRFGGIIRDILFNSTKYIETNKLLDSFNEDIIEENNELKSMMGIDYSLKDFNIVYASIVERNNSYWLNEITINKGKIDGVNDECVVVTENGLIGKVISSSTSTSKVRLITSDDNSISVKIKKKNKILTTNNNNLIIRGINDKDKIKIGDKVLTSGLSDIYPEGILIGQITELNKEKNGVGYIAKVKLSQDIDNIRFVAVLKREDK